MDGQKGGGYSQNRNDVTSLDLMVPHAPAVQQHNVTSCPALWVEEGLQAHAHTQAGKQFAFGCDLLTNKHYTIACHDAEIRIMVKKNTPGKGFIMTLKEHLKPQNYVPPLISLYK